MANAVHAVTANDTLTAVARAYYNVGLGVTIGDPAALARIIAAIRAVSPDATWLTGSHVQATGAYGVATFNGGTSWKEVRVLARVGAGDGRVQVRVRQSPDRADYYACEIDNTGAGTAIRLLHGNGGSETQIGSDHTATAIDTDQLVDLEFSVRLDAGTQRLTVLVDGAAKFTDVAAPATAPVGTVALVAAVDGGARAPAFARVAVERISDDKVLLEEAFAWGGLPGGWSFVDGDSPWQVGPADDGALFDGSVLYVPTLTGPRRVLYSDAATQQAVDELLQALHDVGIRDGRQLARMTLAELKQLIPSAGSDYVESDVNRTHGISGFLTLDGMSVAVAEAIYDGYPPSGPPFTFAPRVDLDDLASVTEQEFADLLDDLVGAGQPPELARQDHARRWATLLRIRTRKALGEVTRARPLAVPFSSRDALDRAQAYESIAHSKVRATQDATQAGLLAALHRFSAHVIDGNAAVQGGRYDRAVNAYQAARREWHRLAVQVVPGLAEVDDDEGLNLQDAIAVAKGLLQVLPSLDPDPFDVGLARRPFESATTRFGFRSFLLSELSTDGAPSKTDEVVELLEPVDVHALPEFWRKQVDRDVSLLTPATAKSLRMEVKDAPGKFLARDLSPKDREAVSRNTGGLKGQDVSAIVVEGQSLLTRSASALGIREIAATVSLPSWATTSAFTGALSAAALATYPQSFKDDTDVTVATPYLRLPSVQGDADDVFLGLNGSFVSRYIERVVKRRWLSTDGLDVRMDDGLWLTPGGTAGMAPWLYAVAIPLGLGQAYARLGMRSQSLRFGSPRVPVWWGESGSEVEVFARSDASTDSPALNDAQLRTCVKASPSVLEFALTKAVVENLVGHADRAYREGRPQDARQHYRDALCAVEAKWASVAEASREAFSRVHAQLQAAFDGTATPGFFSDPRNISLLAVVVVETGLSVFGDLLELFRPPPADPVPFAATVAAAGTWFLPLMPTEDVMYGDDLPEITDVPSACSPLRILGRRVEEAGPVVVANHTDARGALLPLYLYAQAKIVQIEHGLNWYGYTDDYVPAWSFEHLYAVARGLCDRAANAEEKVQQALQMLDVALEREFIASQQEALSEAGLTVAERRLDQAVKEADLRDLQAEIAVRQERRRAILSTIFIGSAVAAAAVALSVVSFGTAAAAIASTAAIVGATSSVGGATLSSVFGWKAVKEAKDVATATQQAGIAAVTAAEAERDLAALRADQATAYTEFIQSDLTFTATAIEHLLALLREVADLYLDHAHRMSWLTQRALEHQERFSVAYVRGDYGTCTVVGDLTRAQRLTADLETMHSEYVAGSNERLQEVKVTLALSQLDPAAWQDLRTDGVAHFVLLQRQVDALFPGTALHRLSDVQVRFIGLLPPSGPKGNLIHSGISWIRVPNHGAYTRGATRPDWPAETLTQGTAPYVLRRVVGSPAVMALSEFDLQRDRGLLNTPQGMLKPMEHQGLDGCWTLELNRQGNDFDYAGISDVEITFWFLCRYDETLEAWQEAALYQSGLDGTLWGVALRSFALETPEDWAAFVGNRTDPEALDVRTLTWDMAGGNHSRWESARKLRNLIVAFGNVTGAPSALAFRLCSDADPVGVALTTVDAFGGRMTLFDVPLQEGDGPVPPDPSEHDPDELLTAWMKAHYSTGDEPAEDPAGRWVLKVSAPTVSADWRKVDADGTPVATTSGALAGDGATAVATYDDGTAWADVSAQAMVRHGDANPQVRVRVDSSNWLAAEIRSDAVRLVDQASTVLASAPLAYPDDEYLRVEVRVVGTKLELRIDGLVILEDVSFTGHATGTVALAVTAASATARFDDLRVARLTGLGQEAEVLLEEPFTTTLPDGWTFAGTWAIDGTGHPVLDLGRLTNAALSLEYAHEAPAEWEATP